MTPAVRALRSAGIPFTVHEYEHDPSGPGYGVEAARKLGFDPDRVFKTLVVTVDGGEQHAVAVIPVSARLSVKAIARLLGTKRVEMCDPSDAERLTGYVVGGISPFGQRRRLPTFVDELAEVFDTIYVSGGRRGLDLGVSPGDLARLLDASFADLISG